MRKGSLLAGFLVLMLLGAANTAEAGGRLVFSFGLGVPVYAPYAYYAPAPVYYPPYPVVYPPYGYYGPRYVAPAVTLYGGAYYGPRAYGHHYRSHAYVRGHVPPGHAYGRYKSRGPHRH